MAVTGTTARTLQLYTKQNGRKSTIQPSQSAQLQTNSLASIQAFSAPNIVAHAPVNGGLPYPTPNTSTDKFVSASAGGSGSGSFASPWTLTQAFANLTAGQRCWLRAGSYTMPADATNAASGTAGNPIELCAYPSETVNCTFPTGGMLFDGNSYWNFWGGNWSCVDTGVKFAIDLASSHLGFFSITGTQSIQDSDNCGLVFCNGTLDGAGFDYLDVMGCNFTGSWNGGGAGVQNAALIYPRKIKHYNIIGNTLQNCWNPIYGKQEITSALTSGAVSRIVRNNIIKTAGRYIDLQSDFAQWDDNLLINATAWVGEDDGARAGGVSNRFTKNTLYNSNIIFLSAAGATPYLRDNALAGTSQIQCYRNSAISPNPDSDYNLVPVSNPFYINSSPISLSTWQGTSGGTRDPHSIAGAATFAGSTSSIVPSDWVLTGPPAALTGSSTGGPIGCDTTKLLTVN